ncbi:Nn.00g050640.m01.CDS01 [Neocucurbitaria sp. VM-36]
MIRTSGAWARPGPWRAPHARNSGSGNKPTVAYQHLRPSPSHATRRHNASKPSVGQKAPETTQTIPGPSWLWLEPIYEPFRAYGRVQQRKPYMTQFVSSLVIYFVGDLVAQSIAQPADGVEKAQEAEDEEKGWVQEWSDNRDWARTGRALAIGGLTSIPSYKWFLWLGNNFNYGSKILSLTTKVVVNQALFTPIFNSYFFGMQSLLSGATIPEIIERIKHTVPTSWINSCKVWPVVTAFSFTYIPIQYRSIFGGVIAIGWQTYLSLLNQRAAAQERKEHEVAAHIITGDQNQEHGEEKEKCPA